MGVCRYCNKAAGFLRQVHAECEEDHKRTLARAEEDKRKSFEIMVGFVEAVVLGRKPIASLMKTLRTMTTEYHQEPSILDDVLVEGWTRAVSEVLEDHILTREEETHLSAFVRESTIEEAALNKDGYLTKVAQAGTLRELSEGTLPNRRQRIDVQLPFLFQESEELVWLFQNVGYIETRTHRVRVGTGGGASFRIAKGVYLRTSSFQSRSEEETSPDLLDVGLLALTDKHLYFAGPIKKFRIPYSKLMSVESLGSGFTVMRDAASAKPQTFVTGDGWFSCNLISLLTRPDWGRPPGSTPKKEALSKESKVKAFKQDKLKLAAKQPVICEYPKVQGRGDFVAGRFPGIIEAVSGDHVRVSFSAGDYDQFVFDEESGQFVSEIYGISVTLAHAPKIGKWNGSPPSSKTEKATVSTAPKKAKESHRP